MKAILLQRSLNSGTRRNPLFQRTFGLGCGVAALPHMQKVHTHHCPGLTHEEPLVPCLASALVFAFASASP